MIRNILFDMGQVLIRWDPPLFVSRLGLNAEDSTLLLREVYQGADWVMLDRGSVTEDALIARVSARLPERLRGYVEGLVRHWDDPPLQIPDMEPLVRELREKGYGVYLLSNAGLRHHDYWQRFPVSRYFGDHVFISADHLLLKPDPSFYETALRQFSLDRSECVFIDDNSANVEGALRCGLDAIVFFGDVPRLRRQLREKGVDIAE